LGVALRDDVALVTPLRLTQHTTLHQRYTNVAPDVLRCASSSSNLRQRRPLRLLVVLRWPTSSSNRALRVSVDDPNADPSRRACGARGGPSELGWRNFIAAALMPFSTLLPFVVVAVIGIVVFYAVYRAGV